MGKVVHTDLKGRLEGYEDWDVRISVHKKGWCKNRKTIYVFPKTRASVPAIVGGLIRAVEEASYLDRTAIYCCKGGGREFPS